MVHPFLISERIQQIIRGPLRLLKHATPDDPPQQRRPALAQQPWPLHVHWRFRGDSDLQIRSGGCEKNDF
jgi:hypothetical protein